MCIVSPDGKDGKTKGCEELYVELTVMNISVMFNANSERLCFTEFSDEQLELCIDLRKIDKYLL